MLAAYCHECSRLSKVEADTLCLKNKEAFDFGSILNREGAFFN